MFNKNHIGGLFLAALLGSSAAALAQTSPVLPMLPPQVDPGGTQRRILELRDDLEREQVPQPVDEEPVQVEQPKSPDKLGAPEDFRFVLKGVRLNESAFLSTEALTRIVQPYLNQQVGVEDLQRLVEQINAQYRARGIATAQAVLLPQNIDDGVLQIDLVEGRLGQIRLSGNRYTKDRFILDRTALTSGEVVDTEALQQALIRFNRTSDIQLRAALQPGEEFGQTDVLLSAEEPPRHAVHVFADNQGVESTGLYQLGLIAHRNGLFGWDDQAALYLVGAEGTLTGSLSYGIPVNRRNGRLSLSYAHNRIEIIKGPFEALDITGDSSTMLLSFDQPLYVSSSNKWDGSITLSRSDSETVIGDFGETANESTVDKLSLGTTVEHIGRSGRWLSRHTISGAKVESSFGSNVDDRSIFGYSGSLSWLRPFESCCTALAKAGWQLTSDNQPPASEQFQIGGLGSVRGYLQGILADARGYYLQLELHRPLFVPGLAGFVFVDHGAVAPESSESITGVGLGLSYRYQRWLSFDISYGAALDRNVIPDQDAGRIDARLVLSFSP